MREDRLDKRVSSRELRANGYSYREISKRLDIPRSTIVSWCTNVVLSDRALARHAELVARQLEVARATSAVVRKNGRLVRVTEAEHRAARSGPFLASASSKRGVLGALYLAEGTKRSSGAATFGNSNPEIVRLYLLLLRECFKLDEAKFRCTVQVREGQDVNELEAFWSEATDIPLSQFYKARVDSRGSGKVLRKPDYKGVCRIDYMSTNLLYELLAIGRILTKGP